MLHSWLTIHFFFVSFFRHASAYTWSFTSQPIQCQNVSIAIQGSGQPPYNLVLVPYKQLPDPNTPEFRKVQNISFTGTSTNLSFNLNYPQNSTFVAVVSDSSGFGTGGTSAPVTVLPSSDSSCYDTKNEKDPFLYQIAPGPSSAITQCENSRLWWGEGEVNSTASFLGIIPGGDSFIIPQGPLSTTDSSGTGFSWLINIKAGTWVVIVGGDVRGIGSGGYLTYLVGVQAATDAPDGYCLSITSPSSTAGSPAGGIPTSASSSPSTSYPASSSVSPSGSSRDHSNTAVIAAVVASGLVVIVALALTAFFYSRRRGYSAISTERPVNVLHDHGDGLPPLDLPHHYAIEPFLVSDPTVGGTVEAAFASDWPLTTADTPRPQTVGMIAAKKPMRKIRSPPLLRPVNIIQHDDACPSEWQASVGEHETIELPPAYGNVRSGQRPPGTASPPRNASIITPTMT